MQPLASQASQELAEVPTQALPPRGAVQWSASRAMLARVVPFALVRQHVTVSERPHVELRAHFITLATHVRGRVPSPTAALTI
jgi:hypothetical protein